MSIAEKLKVIAENVPKVYEAGKAQGSGMEAFWESYQQSGSRVDYRFAFAGAGWNDDSFTPKYDIKPTQGQNLFNGSRVTDLLGYLEDNALVFDLSSCTNCQNMFLGSSITRMPVLDTRSSTSMTNFLGYSTGLTYVELIYLPENVDISYAFDALTSLEYIRFGSSITKSINFASSTKLGAESIDDILSHLGGSATCTLTLPSVAPTTYDAVYGEGTFEEAINVCPSNWTVAY